MKTVSLSLIPCAVTACLALSCLSSGAQTLIYSDTFPGAAGNLDSAPTTGISGLDGGSSGALPQSAAVESTISGSSQLVIATPGDDGSGDNGYIRFDTIGSSSTLYNWAASPGASAITSAGGMTVSFLWTPANTTSSDWIYFGAGVDPADSFGYGYSVPIWSGNSASGIILANNGNVATFHGSSSTANSGSFTPSGSTELVSLIYSFNSWAAGAPVSLTAVVNGQTVISGDSFNWNSAEAGANYLNLGSYQEANTISDFQISTVPEPATWTMLASGLALLLAASKPRQARG
jgi:hypothetical protein